MVLKSTTVMGEEGGCVRMGRGLLRFVFQVAAFLVLASGPATAQNTVDPDGIETDTGVVQTEAALQSLESAKQALKDAPQRDVTYAEVLSDPDNIALNFAYAQTQVRRGRLKGAATTLERILLLQPNLHEVRLFYALVLLRLDSLDAAERELKRLETLDMEPRLRAELQNLLDRIAATKSRWEASVLVGFGMNYDWNVNSVPGDRIRLFAGVPANVDDADDRTSDISYAGFARYDVAYDLGFQARHQWIGSLLYFTDDQVVHDALDIGSFAVETGARLRFPGVTVTPTVSTTNLWLSKEQYFTGYAAAVDFEVPLPPDMELFGGVRHGHERFYFIRETTAGPDQNGPRTGGNIGLELDWDNQNRLTAEYDIELKRGVPLDEHRWSHDVTLGHLYLFEHGGFMNTNFVFGYALETNPDPGDDPDRRRRDRTFKFRTGYGAPIARLVDLDWMAPHAQRAVGGAVISITGEAFRSTSTIRNFQYWNRRGELLMTRKWTF